MPVVIICLILIVGFVLFLSYKKKEYNANKKDPEEGGIDLDSDSGDGDGGGA